MKKQIFLFFITFLSCLRASSPQSPTLTCQNDNVKYYYDSKGRLSRWTVSPSIDYEFNYDASGYLVQVVDHINHLETLRDYDSSGRLIFEKLGNELTITYERDQNGNCVKKILSDGSSIEYTYHRHQLTSIKRKDAIFTYTDFDTFKQPLSATLANDLGCVHWKWYNDGKLIQMKCPFLKETLSYNEAGQIAFCQTNDHLQAFFYDDKGKLISEEKNDFPDAIFDSLGNLQEKQGLYLYYDPLGRLVTCEKEKAYRCEYLYDVFHRRLSKTYFLWDQESEKFEQFAHLSFLWDEDQEIGAVNAAGEVIELRCLGIGFAADIGAICFIEIDGQIYQAINNFRGDLVQLIDITTGKCCCSLEYTPYGTANVTGSIYSPWQFLSKRVDPETGFIYFGKRFYDPTLCQWITADPQHPGSNTDDHAFLHDDPINQIDFNGSFSYERAAYQALSSLVKTYNFTANFMTTIRNQFDYPTYLRPSIESIGKTLFGSDLLLLAGFYSDEAATGIYGKGELSDKVRVTYINGILNSREVYKDSLECFSSSHGGINIHYIYNPTDGWTWDLIKCFEAKFGVTTPQAKHLAETWKNLIQEIGGPENGGKIIHYCHSIGGTHTANAKSLMTPEELKMIHVISIGSATLIEEESFGKVTNYISVRDGVCMLHPIPWVQAMLGYKPHTQVLGNFDSIPLIDHPLSYDTYGQLIKQLGEEFLNTYL